MIGGILFTSAASANLGVNIKTWRLFADASNDVGLALEMLAPLPAFRGGGRFLRLICVASVFKAACGVAGGATGAAITEHWAAANNIADVGAKVRCLPPLPQPCPPLEVEARTVVSRGAARGAGGRSGVATE